MPGYKKCAVFSCVTSYEALKKFGVRLRFFSFPKDKALRDEWLSRCNKSPDDLAANEGVCSRHFHANDYKDIGKATDTNDKPKLLKPTAIPSRHLEKRSQNLLKSKSSAYHYILAQEILKEEKEESCKSSEPICFDTYESKSDTYESKSVVQRQYKNFNLIKKADVAQMAESQNDPRPLQGKPSIELKKNIIIKLEDIMKNPPSKKVCKGNDVKNQDFIGNCYICDRKIKIIDIGQVPHGDIVNAVDKALKDIPTKPPTAITAEDGLCSACRGIVARMSKLEDELRTLSLSLRALLRLKYSLPLPQPELAVPQLNQQLSGLTVPQSNLKLRELTSPQLRGLTIPQFRLIPQAKKRDSETQCCFMRPIVKREKQTQISTGLILARPKQLNKKTQTIKSSSEKITCKPEVMKIVGSINEVECLETEYLQGEISDLVQISSRSENLAEAKMESNVIEVECSETDSAPEDYSDMQSESTVRISAVFSGEIPGDVDASALDPMWQHNYSTPEIEVISENILQADKLEERPKKRKHAKTKVNTQVIKCSRCSFKTKSLGEMKTHMLSFINREGFYCSICDFAYHRLANYLKHERYHSKTNQNKRCQYCDALVHDRLHMKFHIEAKHRPNSFNHKCNICNHVFMFARSMRRHLVKTHKVQDSFVCEKCGKSFADKVKYANHVEFYHRDTLNCKYCSKRFFTISKLSLHENTHRRLDRKLTQGVQCSYCPRRFVSQDLLPKHEMRHTGQFEYRCEKCSYGFYDAESLEKHIKGSCVMNERSLRKGRGRLRGSKNKVIKDRGPRKPKEDLVKKERVRKPLSSVVCDVCGKVMKQPANFQTHRALHDNPAPAFQCQVCGRRFRWKESMRQHIKKFHSADANRDEIVKTVLGNDDQTDPDDANRDELATDEVVTDEVVTDEVVMDEIVTDEVVMDEIVTDEVVMDEIVTEVVMDEIVTEVVMDETVTDEMVTEEIITDEVVKTILDSDNQTEPEYANQTVFVIEI